MRNIELVLSEGIKNGKWIDISYINNQKEITYYWIAIKDIDLQEKILYVSIFNAVKSVNSLNAKIKFKNILSAKILEFTNYETPFKLIKKIENNREEARWLKFDSFNNNILKYYLKCNQLDNDPFQKDTFLISGIDKDILLKNKEIVLDKKQELQIIDYVKKYDGKISDNKINNLILSILSIDEHDKKYVVLYYDIFFNPDTKKLKIGDFLRVNQNFLISNKKHSLSSYINMDSQEFTINITKNTNKYLKYYTEIIRENLRSTEMINQIPEFMILQRTFSANLIPTYDVIEEKINKGILEFPLKAFFGNTNRFGAKRKEPNIVIYDNKVNIDQMRVIYNAMKYPITYVQGPPGTGKTQTILNVILSAFFNSKTVLVCSSNNKPIDGILEKLFFLDEDYGNISFPYVRLGNRNEIIKTTMRILNLYELSTKIDFDELNISILKEKTKNENKELLKYLEIYENKLDLKNRINSANTLYNCIDNHSSHLFQNIQLELQNMIKQYNNMPDISNQDILSLVKSISNDKYLLKYMYFESLKYIKKLKMPKYKPLIDICRTYDENRRINLFNKWCSDDDNIRLLENVFPIIFTTNISATRLGTANHIFDLVIMDEAGQCNCATALISIARAKQLLLVGDTNQLKPVILLENIINDNLKNEYSISDDYDYSKYSILDVMRNHDNISKDIMLTYHYRCGKKIINFSNKRFYNGKLNLEYLTNEGNLSLLNVKNINSRLKNENYEEAKAIIEYVKRNNLVDAAIITPFKNQQNLINSMLKENNIEGVTCGTIHQVQGDEKSTIIISTSLSLKTSKKTFDWIKNNAEITNVAVTRAKNNLIVVSDVEALEKLSEDKKDDLYNLVKYVTSNGNLEIQPNESYSIQIGNSNGSKNEDIFFRTISHFCSVNNNFQAKRNVKIASLFPNDTILANSKLEFDIVLYEINNTWLIPRIAIELQGGEHFGNIDREKCDARKVQICNEKNIYLLEIPNSFAKSYETIKELILSSCGQKIEQLELF